MTTVADVGTEIGKKSELDLLVDEIIKTQNAIGDIQSSFNKLEKVMNQEYANFHNALNEGKIKLELLESRLTNQKNLQSAKLKSFKQTLKNSEDRFNYRMNVLLQDVNDDIGKLQLLVQSTFVKMKEIQRTDTEITNDNNYSNQMPSGFISVIQVITDFFLWAVSFASDPVENMFHLAIVAFMIFVIFNVCGFLCCNVLCAPYRSFSFFSFVDRCRSYWTQN